MTAQPEIAQQDLCDRSEEIVDAVERGQAFALTHDGHQRVNAALEGVVWSLIRVGLIPSKVRPELRPTANLILRR